MSNVAICGCDVAAGRGCFDSVCVCVMLFKRAASGNIREHAAHSEDGLSQGLCFTDPWKEASAKSTNRPLVSH